MLERLATPRLLALWKKFPAVLILGARQVGKTTLAQMVFPKAAYCDLEEPQLRQLFLDDPTFQIEQRQRTEGLILDEAQFVPDCFASLRGIIDRDRKRNGRFLILGSSHPALIQHVAESLAGRVAMLDLDPLAVREIGGADPGVRLPELWLRGGFPDAFAGEFREWWEAYVRTYVERDLPQLGLNADPILLRRVLTMIAHCQAGLQNLSQLGKSLGVSYHTVERYVSLLEHSFLVRRLPPYHRNIGKRLVKAPKIYLRDTGLLHHLLNISTLDELENHPIRGASWETFVSEDLMRRERLAFPQSQFYFWRTATGDEIDLVIERGDQRFAFEMKAGSGKKSDFAAKLANAVKDTDSVAGWILDGTREATPLLPNVECRGYLDAWNWLPA
ncbi:MAG: ATP-binding protein [Planctomycetota bacterium]